MPLPTPPAARAAGDPAGVERGQRRMQRIRWTVAAAMAGRGGALLVTLVTIPLTVKYLGPERYGYWVAIVSTTTLLAFADLGLGYGLLNRAAAALGLAETAGVRRLVSNAFFLLAGVSALGLLLLFAAFGVVPWARWFPDAGTAATVECARAVAVLMAAFLAGLPLMTWQRTVGATQEGFWSPCFDAVGGLGSLAGLWLVISHEGGLVALAIAYAAGPWLALLAGWLWFFFGRRPDLRPRRDDWDFGVARGIMAEGACYLVLQLGGVLLASVSSLIILQRCGAGELGRYSLAAKLFQFGPQLAAFWFAPVWPAYSEALARGDAAWAHRTLWKGTGICVLVGLAGCAVLVPAVGGLVRLWTGMAIDATWALRAGLGAVTVCGMAATSISTYLNASRFLLGQVWVTVLHGATALGLAWWLAGRWGSAGAVWGLVLGYAVVVAPAYAVILPGVLARQRRAAKDSS